MTRFTLILAAAGMAITFAATIATSEALWPETETVAIDL
jgi:hypothetical protein|tara:strand:+ start:1100 stop:1216 length:117 start_codon:yes stop_codon:yes gene_type:complete